MLPLVSSGIQVLSRVSAHNVLVAGAIIDENTMVVVEVRPEVANVM